MTHQEILEKAIQKAQANGWWVEYDVARTKDMGWTVTAKHRKKDLKPGEGYITNMISENDIIFNHDFAKALWGEEKVTPAEGRLGSYFGDDPFIDIRFDGFTWQYHLQQMVLADDPIRYLGDHLG